MGGGLELDPDPRASRTRPTRSRDGPGAGRSTAALEDQTLVNCLTTVDFKAHRKDISIAIEVVHVFAKGVSNVYST